MQAYLSIKSWLLIKIADFSNRRVESQQRNHLRYLDLSDDVSTLLISDTCTALKLKNRFVAPSSLVLKWS